MIGFLRQDSWPILWQKWPLVRQTSKLRQKWLRTTTKLVRYDKSGKCDKSGRNRCRSYLSFPHPDSYGIVFEVHVCHLSAVLCPSRRCYVTGRSWTRHQRTYMYTKVVSKWYMDHGVSYLICGARRYQYTYIECKTHKYLAYVMYCTAPGNGLPDCVDSWGRTHMGKLSKFFSAATTEQRPSKWASQG